MYSGTDALSAGLRSDSIFMTGRFFAIASVIISAVSIIILVMAMFITCCCSASTLKYAVGTLYMLTFLWQCIAFLGTKPPASVCGVISIEQNLRTECSASTTVGLGAVASALYVIAFLQAFIMPWPEDPYDPLPPPTSESGEGEDVEIALTENDEEEKEKVVVEK